MFSSGGKATWQPVAAAVVAAAFLMLSRPLCGWAQTDSQEYMVKAAFLYNFTKFVEWPQGTFEDPSAPFVLAVLGEDPFGEALAPLKEKTVEGRRVVIQRAARLEDLEKCQILFISASEKGKLEPIFRRIKNWKVLTVGETKGFAQSGVMINLTKIEEKVGFEINAGAVEAGALKMSSKLLKLGIIVGSQTAQ